MKIFKLESIIYCITGLSILFPVGPFFAKADSPTRDNKCSFLFLLTKAHEHKDLDNYIAEMEHSGLQKAAFASHVRSGRIVDLGSGSGVSAYDMAILFPDSKITGVDLDPNMVQWAQNHYRKENLNFIIGNAEVRNFPANSLSGIFMSSTGHHLTSFGEGSFDVQHVTNAFKAAHSQLSIGGVFVFRDFLVPENSERLILLDLPNNNGNSIGELKSLSTAALFKKFANDFQSSQHPHSGVVYELVSELPDSWTRFRLSLRDATEFLLRKDYRDHYEAEIKEEYTFMSQKEIENTFRKIGFRILQSTPIHNPWIVVNRFIGQARLFEIDGNSIPFPATNYIIAGEKVDKNAGVGFREVNSTVVTKPSFLVAITMRDKKTHRIFDIVERPNDTIDVIPYFLRNNRLYVMGKQGFPRPIVITTPKSLSGSLNDPYLFEPISFINTSSKSEFAAIEEQLQIRTGIKPSDILSRGPGEKYKYYTSPGILNEKVTSISIPIRSQAISSSFKFSNYSGFSTSGVIRPIEATQVLRMAQAGSMLDARMEIGVYNLLLDRGASVGPWIGEDISVINNKSMGLRIHKAENLLIPKLGNRAFDLVENSKEFGAFLEVKSSLFEEFNFEGQTVASQVREYVLPKNFSTSVVSTLPFVKINNEIYVGLEERHLPGVQINEGRSNIITNPAWRMKMEISNLDEAISETLQKLEEDFGAKAIKTFSLGGPYNSSPGVTAERIYPYAIEVSQKTLNSSKLKWVNLKDLIQHRQIIKDANLLLAALRLAHALNANSNTKGVSLAN